MLNTLLAYIGYLSIFILIFGMGGFGFLLDTSPRLKNTIKFFTFSFFTMTGVVAGFVIIAHMPDTLVPFLQPLIGPSTIGRFYTL